jgi:hypothetical protein
MEGQRKKIDCAYKVKTYIGNRLIKIKFFTVLFRHLLFFITQAQQLDAISKRGNW